MYEKYRKDLYGISLFDNIDKNELIHILNCLSPVVKEYKKDDVITIEGHDYKGIGIVLNGEVLVTKENELGERHVITKLNTGKLFGEMVAFSPIKKWPATIFANSNSVIMFIAPESLISNCQNLCGGHKRMMLNFIRVISAKALMLNRKMDYLSIKSMRGKLAKYLIEESNKQGKLQFDISLNRNELADYLNVSRPSMSRELGRMKEERLIDFHQFTFKIKDVDSLKETAAYLR